MQLSFSADKSTDLAFKVGIAGTQTVPTMVSVVLERDGKTISYKAEQQGDEWVAKIENPGSMFKFGEVKLSVNVVIHNRIFTPLKSVAMIVGDTSDPEPAVQHDVEPMTVDVPKDAPNEVSHAEITLPAFEDSDVVEQVVPTPEPAVVKPTETEEQKKQKVKDLLARAQKDVDKKKSESTHIRTSLLKSVDQAPPVVESEKPKKKKSKPADVFSIKKLGVRTI